MRTAFTIIFSLLCIGNLLAQSYLPDDQTEKAIGALEVKLYQDQGSPGDSFANQEYSSAEGFQQTLSMNTMFLKIRGASGEKLRRLLEEHNATVIAKYPKLGTIVVKYDSTKYSEQIDEAGPADPSLQAVLIAMKDFERNEIVLVAVPDVQLEAQIHYDQANSQSEKIVVRPSGAREFTDWGIKNINADKLWTNPASRARVVFGIVDTGFATHEDVSFEPRLSFGTVSRTDQHGTSTAGVACARHNQLGTKGVLPNCVVRPIAPERQTGFNGVLDILSMMVDRDEEVSTISVSLGFGWKDILANTPEAKANRLVARGLGIVAYTLGERARETNKIIFASAGNDSGQEAYTKFNSPLTWASIHAKDGAQASNIVVVEAHGFYRETAGFSNRGGQISCPGVGVFAPVALNNEGKLASNVYAYIWGTSIATPYCASGFALLRLLRPHHTAAQLMSCLTVGPRRPPLTSIGTPRMDLELGLLNCPEAPRT